jgi:NHL repeat-containing protein
VLRVTPGGVSTLTTDSSPTGGPDLDYPSGMAFLPDGDIVVTDKGSSNGPIVVEVNPVTGARTLISGDGTGSGPELAIPYTVAVEASGDILVADSDAATGAPQLLRITPASGNRAVLTGNGVGSGPALTIFAMVGLERGVIYLMDFAGTIVSVDPVTGDRTLVSGSARGTGPALVAPVSMTSDAPDSVVVADRDHWSADTGLGRGALVRVDLATGNRTVLSDTRRRPAASSSTSRSP